jgi:hypothetical protein
MQPGFQCSSNKVKNKPFIANILDKCYALPVQILNPTTSQILNPTTSHAGDVVLTTGIPSSPEEGRLIFKFTADT